MTFNTLSFRNLPIVHHKKVQPNTNMQFQDKLPADQNHLQTKILYCNHTTMSTSAARNSPYKLQGLVTLLFRYKISPSAAAGGGPVTSGLSNAHQISHRRDFFSTNFFGYGRNVLSQQQSRSFSGSPKEADGKSQVKDEERKIQSTSPVSDKQSFSTWAKWLLGSFLTLLPFLKQKWERLKGIEGKVEKVVEEAEVVAEVAENVATVAENVTSEVAEKLPDNSKIKQAVLVVEEIASVTAQEAKLAEDFIHKVMCPLLNLQLVK
ncbi:OLC1v1002702C3 [Oldenlandia corymbosa var. corymbosa]|uniref:OLC1v1002702C3 n=1 Tax=Oldenlandia corymbosa var. corymbosa TaxID=529605 RepID=A0AAV1D899_OLDCO|nr:OLC1v1002702C3 [Oldenlandia corymbosa var. corymbosa]